MKLIDKIFAIHMDSLETSDLRAKFGHFQYMGFRLYKFYHYTHQATAGVVFNDASEFAMISAYVLGTLDLQERNKSKFSVADIMLQSDTIFYNALWHLIAQKYTDIFLQPLPVPVLSDLDVNEYCILDRKYLDDKINLLCTYCELNNIKIDEPGKIIKSLINFYRIQNRNVWHKNTDLIMGHRILHLMFSCLVNDYNKYPEPYKGFWLGIAQDAWLMYLQQNKKKIRLGLRFRESYLDGHRLYPQYHQN